MPRTPSGKTRVARVRRKQKNGDTYVYEVTSLYNPEKKYNECVSSKLIGKIPAGETEIVPTRPKRKSKADLPAEKPAEAKRMNVGATDILEWIGRESGIDADMYASADIGTAQKALSIARFWTANQDKSVRRIEEWQIEHELPYVSGLSEDICYNLMQDIGYNASIPQSYFKSRASHSSSGLAIAVDSTTIYSYSEYLNDVRYGYNKDGNNLPTVKLLTLYDVENHQPIAYARQPGNIPDVSSVVNTLKQFSVLGYDKAMLTLDGGFYSESNMLELIHSHTKFLMRGEIDCKWIKEELDSIRSEFSLPSNVCQDRSTVFGITKRIKHCFVRGNKKEEHVLYLHFYYDTNRAKQDKDNLLRDILHVKVQLESGNDYLSLSAQERRIADKYLIFKQGKGRLKVSLNDKAILKEEQNYGFFVLISNKAMDKDQALRLYILREKTEECFRVDKQSNDAHSTRSKLGSSLEGRFFCQFLAMGYEMFFLREINRVKKSLAVPNGDPAHDNSQTFKKEKDLLNWLNKMSVAKIFDWFDATQETTVNTVIGKARWRTETIERDRLFLQKLGVIQK